MARKPSDNLSKHQILVEALKYALGTAGALVLAAVSIDPTEATRNLNGWIRLLNPSVSASFGVAEWVVVAAVVGAVAVIAIALGNVAISLQRQQARQLSMLAKLTNGLSQLRS
jgi:hypothetical protein